MSKAMVFFLAAGIFFLSFGFAQESGIIEAAKTGDSEKVKALLQADPKLVGVTDKEIGATALHWALIYGKKEAAKTILAFNPDVNRTEAHGGTTMHWAAHFDDAESIAWLLDRGAKIDHVNQLGRTPLLVAARRGCVDVAGLLLKKGAYIHARTKDGSTALHIAARNGHAGIIDLLITQGLEPDQKDHNGRTYRDVLFRRPEIVKIDPSLYAQYAGSYALPQGGPKLEIHLEGGKLYFYAFGKDELLPISATRFITSAEVKYFEFVSDSAENVTEVIIGQGNESFRLEKE